MLPRLDRLNLTPTGEFYALTPAEAAEEDEDPIFGNPFLPGQAKGSLVATFRVRSKDPRPGTTDQYFYHYFEAQSLWDWVRKRGQAFNPKTRDPLWKEDWLALHDRFDPTGAVPNWVRNLPQLDPNFAEDRAYGAGAAAHRPDWRTDLTDAFNISRNFVEDRHGDMPMEEAISRLQQALRRILHKMDELPNDYRQPLLTYESDLFSDLGPPSITDVVENLLTAMYADTTPLQAKTACIWFVAELLREHRYVPRVADYVYDESAVDHDRIRNGLDQYIQATTTTLPTGALSRNLNALNALRLRHHTFWNTPILDAQLRGPPRSANPPAPMLTGHADALMILLKEKVGEATEFMADFTHELDVISDFFEVEEHSHYTAKPTAEHASERLSEVEELFRKSATFPDDGRRRALAVTLFANVLNVFVESVMWNEFRRRRLPALQRPVRRPRRRMAEQGRVRLANGRAHRSNGALCARRREHLLLVVRGSVVRDGRGAQPDQVARDSPHRPGGCRGGAEVVERVDWALPPQPASCARAASGRGHAWTAPAAHGGVAVAPKREYPRRGSNPRPAD